MVTRMAKYIEQGESVFIPFHEGVSITDSQLHFRMYKTKEMFKRHFPRLTEYDVLCEYAPVVRCKDCKYWENGKDYEPYCNAWGNMMSETAPDDFCSYGERKDDA